MKYYRIKHQTETHQIGMEYPQAFEVGGSYVHDGENSIEQVAPYELVGEMSEIDHIILNRKGLQTDLLSCSLINHGILVSSRMRTVFDKFDIQSHDYVGINVYVKEGEILNYHWLIFTSRLTEYIDFESSRFDVTTFSLRVKEENVEINSYEDYLMKKEKAGFTRMIKLSELHLRTHLNLHLFTFGVGDFDFYVSSELKSELENSGITGLDFLPAPLLINC
jgi:hypothetical protein